jgi:hypothetical protein
MHASLGCDELCGGAPPAVIVCGSWRGAAGAAAADDDSDGDVAPPQDQRYFARALAILVLVLTFF